MDAWLCLAESGSDELLTVELGASGIGVVKSCQRILLFSRYAIIQAWTPWIASARDTKRGGGTIVNGSRVSDINFGGIFKLFPTFFIRTKNRDSCSLCVRPQSMLTFQ